MGFFLKKKKIEGGEIKRAQGAWRKEHGARGKILITKARNRENTKKEN
jgi:hypothetical protein